MCVCVFSMYCWLVVTGTTEFYLFQKNDGDFITPTDFHSIIFQDGDTYGPSYTSYVCTELTPLK